MTEHLKTHLIIVPGHGVCQAGCTSPALASLDASWTGIFPDEAPFYIEHIQAGVNAADDDKNALLIFSGGQTRQAAGPRSEAESYFEIARDAEWWGKESVAARALREEYARDSLENLLFSIALFIQHTSRWPERITLAGWRFKEKRFDLHRAALEFPAEQFHYLGVNDPTEPALQTALAGEQRKLAAVHIDPFLSSDEWQQQRAERNPFQRQHPYLNADKQIDTVLMKM
jgi:hypothetical protein